MLAKCLGLVGLRSAGHDVVGRMIAGAIAARGGNIRLEDQTIRFDGPEAAIAAGIGFVSSKRTEESICAGLAVRENLFAEPRHAGLTIIGAATERSLARKTLDAFRVRPRDPERPIATLSGGNDRRSSSRVGSA